MLNISMRRRDLARFRPFTGIYPLAAITSLAAAVRFSTLGSQSFWYDEAVTVHLVREPFWRMVAHGIPASESTPPLYYVVAWVWVRMFGTTEVGIRSLSALVGTALVPVAYAAGRELISRRVGLIAGGLVAVSPILVWYSQEARSYELLVFFTGLSLAFFGRALRTGSKRALAGWAMSGALALATHYFAVFVVVPEGLLLLVRRESRRATLIASSAVGLVGAALLPLAVHQRAQHHLAWLAGMNLGERAKAAIDSFLAGTYQIPHSTWIAAIGALLVVLVLWRADPPKRRGVKAALAIGVAAIVLPLLLAAVGVDYVLDRNLLPAWLPLALCAAAAVDALGGGRVAIAAALCAASLSATVVIANSPLLQRPDWRLAAQRLGPYDSGDVIVIYPYLEAQALSLYRPDLSAQSGATRTRVVSFLGEGAGEPLAYPAPPGFRLARSQRFRDFTLTTFVASAATTVDTRLLLRRRPIGENTGRPMRSRVAVVRDGPHGPPIT
jgi:4-amino-4-deoxy-L-arabinose transferase-like glycosyltransferase